MNQSLLTSIYTALWSQAAGGRANFVEDEIVQLSKDYSCAFTTEEQTCTLSTASVIAVEVGGISQKN